MNDLTEVKALIAKTNTPAIIVQDGEPPVVMLTLDQYEDLIDQANSPRISINGNIDSRIQMDSSTESVQTQESKSEPQPKMFSPAITADEILAKAQATPDLPKEVLEKAAETEFEPATPDNQPDSSPEIAGDDLEIDTPEATKQAQVQQAHADGSHAEEVLEQGTHEISLEEAQTQLLDQFGGSQDEFSPAK